MYKIKLVKSLNSCKENQILTAHSLGLRKIGDTVFHPENSQTVGKINKIIHLIETEKTEEIA